MPPPEVENAAREALKAGDTTPVDETRQAYSAWFAVAAVDMGMPSERAHAFAHAGYAAQRDGADVKGATSIAQAAVAGLAGPPAPPLPRHPRPRIRPARSSRPKRWRRPPPPRRPPRPRRPRAPARELSTRRSQAASSAP